MLCILTHDVGCNNPKASSDSHEYYTKRRFQHYGKCTNTSISCHVRNFRECKLDLHLAQCFKVLDLIVFDLQNVEETYTTVQQTLQLSNIQTWFNATLKYRIDCYSPLCSSYLRPYCLKLEKHQGLGLEFIMFQALKPYGLRLLKTFCPRTPSPMVWRLVSQGLSHGLLT